MCNSDCNCFGDSDVWRHERNREQKGTDTKITDDINKKKKENRRTHKVLLLGTGGGGKTTFLNQMKIILNEEKAFSDEARVKYHHAILSNIFDGVKTLVVQMEELHIKYDKIENSSSAAWIRTTKFKDCLNQDKSNFKPEYVVKISSLWKDKGIQRCFERRNEFSIQDSVKYFLDNLEEIVGPNLPRNEDILHARVKTEQAYQSVFYPEKENKDISMILIDVGGQRELRNSWIPLFDDVTSIIFITSLSEFDQTLEEDEKVNRCAESLYLFKRVLKLENLKRIPIILFLNKKDLLVEKLKGDTELNDYFPDFDASDEALKADADKTNEPIEALFLRRLYLKQQEEVNAEKGIPAVHGTTKEREVFAHITQATNKENIQKIWEDIKKIVLTSVLGIINL